MKHLVFTFFPQTVRDIIINPGQTEEDLNSKSQLYFQTDGEWKPLNIKIREHKVIEREEKFSVIVYEVPLYFACHYNTRFVELTLWRANPAMFPSQNLELSKM